MLDAVSKLLFGKDRVKWALPKVAAVLKDKFGPSGVFTPGQVRRALEEARVGDDLHPMIYATACIADDFVEAGHGDAEAYAALREEVVRILDLPHSNLSMRLFMSRHRAETGNSGEGGEV
ncbi:MAG: hypothetical protein NW215_02355 [Hyphomicrobiales bacterium]|nr:hypothetical protein [Hyphomicrobiales bacterium]